MPFFRGEELGPLDDRDPSIVHQDIETSEFFDRPSDHRFARMRGSDLGLDENAPWPELMERGFRLDRGTAGNRDGGACLGKPFCHAQPNAAVPASDEGNAPREVKKIAFPHSITSSARASSVAGTSRPSALAVLRLITSSNFVGC